MRFGTDAHLSNVMEAHAICHHLTAIEHQSQTPPIGAIRVAAGLST
jgi:hypothetical protein